MSHAHGGKKVILIALAMNTSISIVKTIVAVLTRSSAMFAEAVHSWADSGNQVLLLVGMNASKRPPTEKHPFGYGKETYFWSFVVAICLFSVGACFSIYEGVHKVLHPAKQLEHVFWAYAVLSVSLFFESISLYAAWKEVKRLKGAEGYWSFLKSARCIEVIVVFLEDIAAQTGLLLALIGLALADLTGWMLFDGLASVSIGLLLAWVAWFLAVEIKSLLIGESAHPDVVKKILGVARNFSSVDKVVRLHTLQMGPEEILVALDIAFKGDIPSDALASEIDRIEAAIAEQIPATFHIYIEPERSRKE